MIPIFVLLLGLVAPSCWPAPVDLPVVRGFEAPACTWCAGLQEVCCVPVACRMTLESPVQHLREVHMQRLREMAAPPDGQHV